MSNDSKKGTFLLIDDDPIFLQIMKRWAQVEGLKMDTYLSLDHFLQEKGSVDMLANFEAALVDCNLEDVDGLRVATYIDTLKMNTPVYLISSSPVSEETLKQLPACVLKFINKSCGHQAIVQELKNR